VGFIYCVIRKVSTGSTKMSEKERYFVVNVGKRRVNRGKNRDRNGKKTWYVSFKTETGAMYLWDTNWFVALIWKIRSILTPYRPENHEYDD